MPIGLSCSWACKHERAWADRADRLIRPQWSHWNEPRLESTSALSRHTRCGSRRDRHLRWKTDMHGSENQRRPNKYSKFCVRLQRKSCGHGIPT